MRTLAWLLVYVVLAAALLGGIGWLVVTHQGDALDLFARYLFPEGWRFAAERLVDHFLRTQLRQILVNATVGGSLLVLSMLLFPVKERVSLAFERGARLTSHPIRELPLWLQGFEELWLAALYATLQMTIFWIGYPPDPRRKQLALALSYATLFMQFGVDFISPLLQRHGLRYGAILKALFRRPLTLFGFGAIFALPAILVGRSHPEWSVPRTVAVLFGVNLAAIVGAILAGTLVGARLLPRALTTRPASWPVRALGFIAMLALLSANLYAFGAVGRSFHHKSQLLKCRYRLVSGTLRVALPDLRNVLQGGARVAVSLDVEIENPTPFDVEIEENRLELVHAGAQVARARISPLRVPAHGKAAPHLEIPVVIDARRLYEKRAQLFEPSAWSATLYLQVTDRIEFPVHLLTAN